MSCLCGYGLSEERRLTRVPCGSFNLGETTPGSGQCVGALAGEDFGLGDNVWLFGDAFMKNVYTAFSFDKAAVGFAALS